MIHINQSPNIKETADLISPYTFFNALKLSLHSELDHKAFRNQLLSRQTGWSTCI